MKSNIKLITVIGVLLLIPLIYLVFVFRGQSSTTDIYPSVNAPKEEQPTKLPSKTANFSVPADGSYTINLPKSQILWKGKKTLISGWVDQGSIKFKSGEAVLANGQLKDLLLVVDMSSIEAFSTGKGSGQDLLSKHLKSPDFFDIEKYPESKFKLLTYKPVNEVSTGEFEVTGELTIKDTTQVVKAIVQVENVSSEIVKVTGTIVLDRTKFNLRYGSATFFDNLGNNVISDEIELNLSVIADQTKRP